MSVALPQKPLGRTGISVSIVGLGGAYLGKLPQGGYDDQQAVATVLAALNAGITLIDTSPLYGESERRLGLALAAWRAQGGRRENLVISSKTGTRVRPPDYSYDHTMRSIEQSLKLLGTDYLDVALVHDAPDVTPALAPRGAYVALRELQAQKVVRAVGLGVREHDKHQRCLAEAGIQVCLTYRDYNLLTQSALDGVVKPAAARGAGVFNAMVRAHGLLGGTEPKVLYPAGAPRGVPAEEFALAQRLWLWCRERQINLLALGLQWCLRRPLVSSTLLGVASPAEVAADLAAISTPFPESLWAELARDFGSNSGVAWTTTT